MNPRLTPVLAVLASLSVLLGGCASAPTTRLHTLLQAGPSQLPANPELVVALDPVTLPAPVDQIAWLQRQSDGSLRVLEHERWAAPLRDEWRAALLQGLARQAGAIEQGQTAKPPSWRVQVHVTQFDSQAQSGADLEAIWTISPVLAKAPGQTITCTSRQHRRTGPEVPALAAGQAANVQALAGQIARALKALASGTPPDCA